MEEKFGHASILAHKHGLKSSREPTTCSSWAHTKILDSTGQALHEYSPSWSFLSTYMPINVGHIRSEFHSCRTKTRGTKETGGWSTSLRSNLCPFPAPLARGWIPWSGPVMHYIFSVSSSKETPCLRSISALGRQSPRQTSTQYRRKPFAKSWMKDVMSWGRPSGSSSPRSTCRKQYHVLVLDGARRTRHDRHPAPHLVLVWVPQLLLVVRQRQEQPRVRPVLIVDHQAHCRMCSFCLVDNKTVFLDWSYKWL